LIQQEISKGRPEGRPSKIQQSAPCTLSLHGLPKINRALDHAGGLPSSSTSLNLRAGRLDAVAQAHEFVLAPGLGSSALSNTRPGTLVPEAIRHSQATTIRLLRFLTIIAAGSCRQAQSTWSVWPLSTGLPVHTAKPLAISDA